MRIVRRLRSRRIMSRISGEVSRYRDGRHPRPGPADPSLRMHRVERLEVCELKPVIELDDVCMVLVLVLEEFVACILVRCP